MLQPGPTLSSIHSSRHPADGRISRVPGSGVQSAEILPDGRMTESGMGQDDTSCTVVLARSVRISAIFPSESPGVEAPTHDT